MKNRFLKFLRKYINEDSPYGDFARDALRDINFPESDALLDILSYLRDANASQSAQKAFRYLYKKSGL